MLAVKRSAGVTLVVNQGIHCMQVTKHTTKGCTLTLKPRADITRSPKQGHQWSHKKDFLISTLLQHIAFTAFTILLPMYPNIGWGLGNVLGDLIGKGMGTWDGKWGGTMQGHGNIDRGIGTQGVT